MNNPSTFEEARHRLVEEFKRSMAGPGAEDELLVDPPSRTYICGFLSPIGMAIGDDQNEAFQEGDNESSLEGIPTLTNAMWPSAMGLTFHVIRDVSHVLVKISGSFYDPVLIDVSNEQSIHKAEPSKQQTRELSGLFAESDEAVTESLLNNKDVTKKDREVKRWKRIAFEETLPVSVTGPTQEDHLLKVMPGRSDKIVVDIRRFDHGPAKPVSITISLVNRNSHLEGEWEQRETRTFFQPKLSVLSGDSRREECFAESPTVGSYRNDPDLAQHLLLHRHARDFATGHGCAVEWKRSSPTHKTASSITTCFIPTATVHDLHFDVFAREDKTLDGELAETVRKAVLDGDETNVIFTMQHLAGGRNDVWIFSALESLCDAYEHWLSRREKEIEASINEIRDESMRNWVKEQAAIPNILVLGPEIIARMRAGIQTLLESAVALHAFRLANEAMHNQLIMATLQKATRDKIAFADMKDVSLPQWRPFQLAFLLLTINSIVCPKLKVTKSNESERELMDLIWFPTGGGKTEAYLGLTAFTLFYRRLRLGDNPDAGAGVSVITRYTLRLLTTQQFERATRLICAAEEIRRAAKDLRGNKVLLGKHPFAIGLWIGGSSTPNRFKDMGSGNEIVEGAVSIVANLKAGTEPETGADVRHIRNCPWCGAELDIRDFHVFNQAGQEVTASEDVISTQVHRLVVKCNGVLPAPLSGPCPFSRLAGIPIKIVDEEIYQDPPSVIIGTVDKFVRLTWTGETRAIFGRLPDGSRLPTPDLIIQDELHLISGPLGTMVGLFETAVDLIAMDEDMQPPKIVGSTATIRRAQDQVWGLFKRKVRQFPPPELTTGESFFARIDSGKPGRMYMGIMAPGTSGKSLFLRCCGAILQLASELPQELRDPYWTLIAYFNSIRELAGGNVLAQDDVLAYMKTFAQIRQRLGEHGTPREIALPEELTSRRRSGEIPKILQHLQSPYQLPNGGGAMDLLLATNMISVGVDVDRLGVMLIQGQPKTTSEYIQASSRVGRRWPGLVLTLANWTRSRDRSHYERFVSYHEAFYKEVEPTSVTPWSGPARDRSLSAVLITVLRQLDARLAHTPAALASMNEEDLLAIVTPIFERAMSIDQPEGPITRMEVEERIKKWQTWARQPGEVVYGTGMSWDRGSDHMLRSFTSPGKSQDGLEAIPNSMRTVEPETGFRLWRIGKSSGVSPTLESTESESDNDA
jgi:hypothetical protein